MNIKQLEKAGIKAIKNLRKEKLAQGFPFMINADLLPPEQCYLEYPDGSITLVTLDENMYDFNVIAELSPEEKSVIRKRYDLY